MSTQPAASDQSDNRTTASVERKVALVAALVVLLLVAALVGAVLFLAADPARTANIRDIVIILFALVLMLVNVAVGVLLVVLVFRLQELLRFLRAELMPLLSDVSQTARTVRGTAAFVSEQVAQPTIRLASFLAGVREAARAANVKVRDHLKRR